MRYYKMSLLSETISTAIWEIDLKTGSFSRLSTEDKLMIENFKAIPGELISGPEVEAYIRAFTCIGWNTTIGMIKEWMASQDIMIFQELGT